MWHDILLAFVFGVLEGITEWLPVSSTGHLILLEGVLALPLRAPVQELFDVVIQLGAILAVAVLYFGRLNPLVRGRSPAARAERRARLHLWGRILLATLPAAAAGFFLDGLITRYLFSPLTVAISLCVYGVLFLLLERNRPTPRVEDAAGLSVREALAIGGFQVLALVPGTSRSGATILGGVLLGLSHTAAAEFSFFLALPTMLGAGLLRSVRFFLAGETLLPREALILAVGTLTAFLVSLLAVRFLLERVRRRGLTAFGVYRLLLGGAVLLHIFLH